MHTHAFFLVILMAWLGSPQAQAAVASSFLRPSAHMDARGMHATHPCLKTVFLPQPLDHFRSLQHIAVRTYMQRYLICDQYWSGAGAPVFFYGQRDLGARKEGLG